jgi:hypothetical protein
MPKDFLVPDDESTGVKRIDAALQQLGSFCNQCSILQLLMVFQFITRSEHCETAGGSDAHTIG